MRNRRLIRVMLTVSPRAKNGNSVFVSGCRSSFDRMERLPAGTGGEFTFDRSELQSVLNHRIGTGGNRRHPGVLPKGMRAPLLLRNGAIVSHPARIARLPVKLMYPR